MYDVLLSMADPVGMLGVTIILVAYFLLSIGKCSALNFNYQLIEI